MTKIQYVKSERKIGNGSLTNLKGKGSVGMIYGKGAWLSKRREYIYREEKNISSWNFSIGEELSFHNLSHSVTCKIGASLSKIEKKNVEGVKKKSILCKIA